MSYLAWYVNGARWSFEAIAEIGGYELERVAIPESRPGRHAPAHRLLVTGLREHSREHDDDYELSVLGRVANHLKRVDEIGAALDAADLDDLGRVLGRRPDPADADAALLDLIEHAGPEREEELVRLLDARAQRMHLAMASPSSLMLRHPRLRSLRADRPTVRDEHDGWPRRRDPRYRVSDAHREDSIDVHDMVRRLQAAEGGERERVLGELYAERVEFRHVPPDEHDGSISRRSLVGGATWSASCSNARSGTTPPRTTTRSWRTETATRSSRPTA